MGLTERSNARRPSIRAVSADKNEVEGYGEQFHKTRRLYNKLAWHLRANRIFLPRNLLRQNPSGNNNIPLPTVIYTAAEPGMDWKKEVNDLQCMWCLENFCQFYQPVELLEHLRTVHNRLTFSLGSGKRKMNPRDSEPSIVVNMRILRDADVLRALSKQRLAPGDKEFIFVNPTRLSRCTKNVPIPSLNKVPGCEKGSTNEQRRRPLRTCRIQQQEGQTRTQRRKRDVDENENWNGYSLVTGLPLPEAAVRKKTKVKKVEKPVLAYPSVEYAIKDKRLFHSVLQSPITVGEYNDGVDSDDNDGTEPEWRLRLAHKEINEYIDTIAIEKLFMHLWNQFIRMEYFAYADSRVASACMHFVKKYRRILQRMNLEVTFLRHLTVSSQLGLLDAESIYETMMVLRDRDPEPKSDLERSARFLFVEEMEQKAKRDAAKTGTSANGVPS